MADLFERGPEVDALLARALDRPTDARRAYVERACGADVRLRDAVLKLLAASEAEEVAPLLRPGGALQGPVFDDLVNGLDSDGPTIAPGTLLGPYEIVSLLGEGGMGQVFRATDLRLRRDVALKVIDERTRSASHVERFAREARAASALNHPNIVTIYDVGREGAMFYIAMELIEGRTLRGYISGGCLDATLLLPLATQLANGLHAAHERGVVHRDLKPSNIIVTENGTAKILDFGLAKREAPRADSSADTASLEENLTGEGLIFGTVGYMSPEQASGKRVDFRSDLFSFGAILYEMATGTAPFKRGSAAETLAAILTEEPAPVDWKGSGLPTQLRIVLERCLAKDPARRFESTGAMLSELTRGDVDARPLTCDSCGGHSSASSQYCSQCGAQLASRQEGDGVARPEAPAPDLSEAGERRHATLLVARPCGYESLIERLPSDDVDELMGRFETIAATVIGRHGGVLNRFAHEEAVGLFGVPTAHEDDAGRAVRAALDLRRRVAGLAREDPRLADLACSVSAAVHTGMIVAQASRQSGERYRIAGDVVGVARSLCDAAGPGEVLMSSESRRLCSASVQAEAKLPVRLRGGSEPTTPHRVVAADDRSPVPLESVEGALTPFAGRAAQLAELDRHLNAADRGHGRFVAVVGDAGSGKSRLLYELRRRVERSDTTALEVRCQAYGRSIAYLPLIQACRDVLDLVEGANAEVQAARAVERILELDAGLERLLPVYLHLLALPSESHPLPSHLVRADLRYAMQEALVALFTATARRRPTLMIVEDCHWIDDASREAILQLAEMCGDASLLVVVSSRTELGAEWSQHAAPITIRLAPLDAASSNEMIRGVLEAHDVPEQLGALIRERSGGNPFFLEELCRKLTSEGYVEARGGVAELTRDIGVLELPDTVQAVIRSRLDRADAGPRELLRQASVIGREFSLAVLERVVGREVRLRSSLATLKQLGLIRQVGVLPHPVYRFQHALTQEVAYDSLLQHQRKALHGRVGRALEAEFGERLDEHCERLAQHFAAAESWEKAVEYGRRSASRASALAQFQEALAALERARAWIARLPDRGGRAEQTVQVLFEEEKACELLGERAKQREAIDQLLALLGDEPRTELVDAHIRNADLLALERRFDEGEVVIQKALTLTRRLGDRSRERDVLHSLVFLRWQGGRNEEALGTLAELLDIDRALGEPGPLVLHLLNRATVLKGLGRYADALPDVREAHSFLDDLDDPNRVNEANYVAYLVYRGLGDEALAESYLRRAAQSIDAASDAVILPHSMATMATMLIERGETEEGIAMLERTVEISRASRYAFGLSQLEQSLGDALLGLGRKQEALPHFRIAAATFRRMRDVGGELRACAGAARIIEADAPVEARTMWERALELARELGESCAAVEAHRGLARLDQAADEPAGAIRHLECALEVSEPESRERADLLNQLGILEWTGGDFESALRRYEEAQSIFAVLGDAVHEGLMLNSMAATLRSMGRQDEAIETLERALEAHVASGQALLEGHALALLGDLHLDREEAPAAIECYAESLELRRKLGDRLGEGWMRHHLGRAELGAARPERAREHVAAAQGIAAECDSSELTAACRDLGLE